MAYDLTCSRCGKNDPDHEHVLNPSACIDHLKAENAKLREALERAEDDFGRLIDRGDLADEPRAHETLQIIRAALGRKGARRSTIPATKQVPLASLLTKTKAKP